MKPNRKTTFTTITKVSEETTCRRSNFLYRSRGSRR